MQRGAFTVERSSLYVVNPVIGSGIREGCPLLLPPWLILYFLFVVHVDLCGVTTQSSTGCLGDHLCVLLSVVAFIFAW